MKDSQQSGSFGGPAPFDIAAFLIDVLKRLRAWFLDPVRPLGRAEETRKVRLLSILLLFALAILLVWKALMEDIPIWIFPILLAAYLAGRTHFYQAATVVAALALFWPSYQVVLDRPGVPDEFITAAFSWQLIAIVFASLLLSTSYLVLLLGINLAGMLFLPLVVSAISYRSLGGAYAVIGWVSISLVIVNQVRDRIELDRQVELIQSEARYRRSTEQLGTLYEISRAISSIGVLPEVLELIFMHVQRVMPLDTFIFSLYDSDSKQLTFPFIYDSGQRWVEAPIQLQQDSWLARLIKNRKPTLIHRKPDGSPAFLDESNTGTTAKEALSIINAPLRRGEAITGSIAVLSSLPMAYTQEHLNLLTGIAYQAATAIENALLYTRLNQELIELNEAQELLQQQSKRAQVFAYVSNLFVTEQRDIASLLFEIARYISQVFDDLCAINLLSESRNFLDPTAMAAQDLEVITDLQTIMYREPQPIAEGLSAYVLRVGRQVRIPDFYLASKSRYSPALLEHFRKFPVYSVIAVPLRAQGQILGVMNLWRYTPDPPYTEEDEVFFMDLGDRIALGIVNAQLSQAVQSELAERTRAETEVRMLNAELEQRVRERTAQLQVAVQELESFAYSVSHDLRAPLRAINGYTTAFQDDFGDGLDPKAYEYLEHIRQSTRRMASLIDDLLSLSRITRSEMVLRQVDMVPIIKEVSSELRKQDPNRFVELVVPAELVVRADPNLIFVALENLIGNAWKFTSKHPYAQIEVGEITQNGERVFFVRDDGAGFDMKFVDRLFTEFQRLHSTDQFDGTGIGLVIVQRVVHRHGGRIWAEAAPEQGATFYFTLGT